MMVKRGCCRNERIARRQSFMAFGAQIALNGWMKAGHGPCRTRTCDLLVRSQTLYPTELRARIEAGRNSECRRFRQRWSRRSTNRADRRANSAAAARAARAADRRHRADRAASPRRRGRASHENTSGASGARRSARVASARVGRTRSTPRARAPRGRRRCGACAGSSSRRRRARADQLHRVGFDRRRTTSTSRSSARGTSRVVECRRARSAR